MEFSIFFISCQKEDFTINTNQEELVKPLYQQRMVSLSEIPKVKNHISTIISEDVFSRTIDGSNQAIFNVDNILEIIDTLNNTNYSFNFRFADTPIDEFYNLVVGRAPNGELKTPFVLKYKSDESHLDQYIANSFSFSYFKGIVALHKYTDFFEPGYFGRGQDQTNCPPEFDEVGDPIPCDTETIDAENINSGGGSGSDNGDNSGDTTGTTGGTGNGNSGGTGGGGNSGTCTWTTTSTCINHEPGGVCGGIVVILVLDCGNFFERRAQNTNDGDCADCPLPEGGIGVNNDLNNLITTAKNTLLNVLEDLSQPAKNFINEPANILKVIGAYDYLEANILSIDADDNRTYEPEAIAFAEPAAEAWAVNGEVDFDNRLIYNPNQDNWYKSKMSPAEVILFDNLTVPQQGLYLKAAIQAYNYAEIHFPRPVRNRKGDAFKHAFWNALSTVYIGETLTEQLTTAHEDIDYNPNYPNHFKETQMDIHNNEKGRQIPYGAGRLYQLVQTALDNGDLRYLNNLEFTNGFWRATDSSQLTPTNQ